MSANDYLIIDTDTHVTEPADVWTSRIPKRYHEQIPQVRRNDKGVDEWFIGEDRLTSACSSAMAGWPTPWPDCPPTYDDAIAGAYDSLARLQYMDEVGIWAMVLYPNVGGFGAQRFLKIEDEALKIDCVRAYNDFLTEFISKDPRRYVAVAAMPFWDVKASIREIERCLKQGHKGILFTCAPQTHGLPFLSSPHWNPFWEAAQDSGLPISFHIGSGSFDDGFSAERLAADGVRRTYARSCVSQFLSNGAQLTDLLLSGVLPRYPKLRFVSVESGIGWLPFVLEAVDHQFKTVKIAEEHPEFEALPSEYFARQVYGNYWFEEIAPRIMLDVLPVDHIMFETDFPHPTSLYRDEVHERIAAGLGGVSKQVRHKILFQNAADLYGIETPA